MTFSNEPDASRIVPDGACAEMSLPLPTTSGRGPGLGTIGIAGAVEHSVSSHACRGYFAVKQAFAGGRGSFAMLACQACTLAAVRGGVCAAPACVPADSRTASAAAPRILYRMRPSWPA